MTSRFHELLLSELRMVIYRPGEPDRLTDELLCEAVTLNENLQSLGLVLRPDDLLRLAVSPSLEGFYDAVAALTPQVKAEPMYPGFPQQVMEMSEAEFRLHQMMHYFSTYGLEQLTSRAVHRGWLPECEGEARTAPDIRLLDARVIELVAEDDAPIAVLKALLDRRERLTDPDLDMVLECVPLCGNEQLQGLTVRFKENLELLFPRLMAEPDRAAALRTLRALCAHSGDVLCLGSEYLRQHRYHLRTAEKRLLVKLLETYAVGNLRENMMLSRKARERNLVVLQHLDYNQYSRSDEHREAVRALRNGELRSWHGMGEALLKKHSPEALDHLAQRPGYMVRMLNRLLSLGYESQTIADLLASRASAISAHLLVKTIRALSRRGSTLETHHLREAASCQREFERKVLREAKAARARKTALNIGALMMERDASLSKLEAQYQARRRMSAHDGEAVDILKTLLKAHFRQADTPLKGKKVWLDMDEFDLEHSTLETEDRSKDGGYIRSGISYRIPSDAKYVRFFVYWNDSERVDVDLHAGGTTLDGKSIHVGWNADFNDSSVVYSGDITHSDAAEYIDIDLSAPVREIYANLYLYSGKASFGEVETCFVGRPRTPEACSTATSMCRTASCATSGKRTTAVGIPGLTSKLPMRCSPSWTT